MPATKITELTAISTVNTTVDPLAIVDVSDTTQASSGTTKKITVSQIDAAIFGASGSKAIVVDNVAALKALTVSGITDGQLYITRGYYSDNDGGQGTYIYDSASAATDNGGTVIAPTAGAGRFLLQYSGELNVKQFGAKGDGVTDNTSAFQSAITQAASSGCVVNVSIGTFISGPLVLSPGLVGFVGSEPYAEKYPAEAQCVLKLKNSASSSTLITVQTGCTSYIKNIVLDGNKASQSSTAPTVFIDVETSGKRDEVGLYNVGIYGGKGWGLKISRAEVELNVCQVINCDLGGIWFASPASSDCALYFTGTGFNGGDGMLFDGAPASACRLVNCDSYFNRGNGIVLNGVGAFTGTQITVNSNFKHSVKLTGLVNAVSFVQSTIFGANWDIDPISGATNPDPTGTYSDVYLDPSSGSYSAGIEFSSSKLGIVFGPYTSAKKPKYCIEDARVGAYSSGIGLIISNNYTAVSSATNFTSGYLISTNVSQNAVISGNSNTQGNSSTDVSFAKNLKTFAGEQVFVGPTTSAGYSDSVKFYQHQNGGLALEYGVSGSKKYATFASGGNFGVPSGQINGAEFLLGPASGYSDSIKFYESANGSFSIEYGVSGSKKYVTFDVGGNLNCLSGNISAAVVGYGFSVKEGTNARMGVATLSAGSVVVSTTSVGSGSRIFLTSNTDGGTPGWVRVSTRTAGTSFTITSSSATDTSSVAWIIIDPA